MPGITQPTDILLGLARFQRNYNFEVLLPDIGISAAGLVGFGLGSLVQSVAFGDYSIDSPSTMRAGPYTANFAGLLTVQTIKMEFLKTFPDAVSAYFNSWKNLMVDKEGLFQVKSKYQKNIYIKFIDATGITMGKYKMIGCFPITFPQYQLDYVANKVTTVPVVFAVDKVEYEWFS